MSWMFANCISLESLDLSNFQTGNVGYMEGMFDNCYNLKTLWTRTGQNRMKKRGWKK